MTDLDILSSKVFEHVLGRECRIGDYCLQIYYGPAIVINKVKNDDSQDCNVLSSINDKVIGIGEDYSGLTPVYSTDHDSLVAITKEFYDMILNIPKNTFYNLAGYANSIINRFDLSTNYSNVLLYVLYKYINSNENDIELHNIIKYIGVKNVIKHYNGKNLREVEFKNGQVWLCKRYKPSNSYTKRIRTLNHRYEYQTTRIVKYKLIKLIKR